MSPKTERAPHYLNEVFEWKQERALIVALLGPPGSGKSSLVDATSERALQLGWLVVRVDLAGAREFWSEDDFYGWLLSSIQHQWNGATWKVRQPRLDFTRLLETALTKAKGQVLLVFDHLEALCDACARSLISSLREVQDIGSSRSGWSKLRCIVSGTASVYELRRRSNSPNLQFVLHILPDQSTSSSLDTTAAFLSQEGHTADDDAVRALAELTGGEFVFLELLLQHLPAHISADAVRSATKAVIADAARVRHLALPAYLYLLDRDFRNVAEGLLAQRLVPGPDTSEDVNRYQLFGATRVDRRRAPKIAFRNGLIEETIRFLGENIGLQHELAYLQRMQEEVLHASSLENGFQALASAWKCLAGEDANFRIHLCAGSGACSYEISRREVRPAPPNEPEMQCAAPLVVAGIDTCVVRQGTSYLVRSEWTCEGCSVTLLAQPNGGFAPSIAARFWLDLWTRFLSPLQQHILELALPVLGRYTLQHGVSAPRKIFVSSTSLDLAEHRLQIIEQIQRRDLFFRGMEYFGANSNVPPAAFIKEQVRHADVYLGIFALRYGSVDEVSGLSMTELEYDEAVRLNKPRLCYVAHRQATFRGADVETDPAKLEKLNAFLTKVKKDVVYEFKDMCDLARQVYVDLGDPAKLNGGSAI